MTANELRIGNLVNFKDEYSHREVTCIDNDGKIDYAYSLKVIEPIPLTEEWLLKFGFDKVVGSDCDFSLQIQKDDKGGRTDYDIWVDFGEEGVEGDFPMTYIVSQSSDWLITDVKSVNQLQNLYFALTGKEFNITVP